MRKIFQAQAVSQYTKQYLKHSCQPTPAKQKHMVLNNPSAAFALHQKSQHYLQCYGFFYISMTYYQITIRKIVHLLSQLQVYPNSHLQVVSDKILLNLYILRCNDFPTHFLYQEFLEKPVHSVQ